ncbi:MAG TPA: HAD-IIIA family hydrolase [Polyangiaceae bacterium]|nr:HAD-IIIA family hydrolase [Polyangiaceae bacterium]
MTSAGARLALLDRDGTLIDVVRDEETGTVTTAFHPSQIRLLDGVVDGLRVLVDAGYRLAIATNQPGPAKGHFSRAAVESTNAALVEQLGQLGIPIARVAACMHHPDGGAGGDPSLVGPCACRKPKPGLLIELMQALAVSPDRTWMIGDSMADVEAGRAAGVRVGLLFADNRCELCPLRSGPKVLPDAHAAKLPELARAILASDHT